MIVRFSLMDQVVKSVQDGKVVHWSNDGYVLSGISREDMIITFIPNGHCVGLFKMNGDSAYEPESFYTHGRENDSSFVAATRKSLLMTFLIN